MPAIKNIMQTSEGYPATGSPNIKVLAIIIAIISTDIIQNISPIIEEIAEEFSDEVKVCKVNIDNEPSLATKFGITSIPTLLLVKNGEVVKTSVGYIPKEKIIELFE